MSHASTPSVTVTTRDAKGLKFLEVAAAAYNKADLSETEAQRVNEAPGLADLIAGHIARHRYQVPPILKLVTGGIPATGAQRFVCDQAALTEANVGWTGDNFKEHFFGKVEENVADASLAVHRLEKDSLDTVIRKELGPAREEIALTHFFGLLKKQSQGQGGHLLVNGYANIAYIKDKNGTLWAVGAYWNSDGRYWRIRAYSVQNPGGWRADYQVVSCDC